MSIPVGFDHKNCTCTKFTVIQETLEKWIGNPHLLLEIASFVTTGLVGMISCESLFFILMSVFH